MDMNRFNDVVAKGFVFSFSLDLIVCQNVMF